MVEESDFDIGKTRQVLHQVIVMLNCYPITSMFRGRLVSAYNYIIKTKNGSVLIIFLQFSKSLANKQKLKTLYILSPPIYVKIKDSAGNIISR